MGIEELVDKDLGKIKEQLEYPLITVSQALRCHTGNYRVKGMITSLTKVFKMISNVEFYCPHCNATKNIKLVEPVFNIKPQKCTTCNKSLDVVNYEYINAVCVELQDREAVNDLERLSVYVFDNYTKNIRVGENTTIKGKIKIHETGKYKKLFSCLHAESIQYEKGDIVSLSKQDIDAIKRLATKHGSNIINELVRMFDDSIIGYENVKEGLLYSAVNSDADSVTVNSDFNYQRQRIHCLEVGEKGLAKSRLLRSAVRLIPRSRFESGTGSSGKSLTAIVEKEDENHTLRLGAIPLARNAICAINEFGRTTFEDQAHFLDIMEEGFTTINKYGINATIIAPTTIIASANPFGNSDWNDDNKIDLNEIPALKPILDRYDLIFIFRKSKDEKAIRKYAYQKANTLSNKIPNYTEYLVKHLEYAKRFKPTINDEANNMLTEFFIEVSVRGFGSNRVYETLCRLIKAVARLKLKEVADEEDARQVMSFYNVMLQNFEMAVNVSTSPKVVTYNEFMNILKNTSVGMTTSELHKTATENNEQIKSYLGKVPSTRTNKKLRNVIHEIENSSNIKRVGSNPIVLQFLSDQSDLRDHVNRTDENNKTDNTTNNDPVTINIVQVS
jgi:replicative DNA helicase Mcm